MGEGSGRPAPARDRRHPARLRNARLAVVQALYQADVNRVAVDGVLEEFLRFRLNTDIEDPEGPDGSKADVGLFTEILRGTAARGAEIDTILAAVLPPDWPMDRLEVLLRAILRAGCYELLARAAVPARVVITEYVELAHAFFTGGEPKMVNGVLDRLARNLRPGELDGAKGERRPPA